jgi:hypothetical protein
MRRVLIQAAVTSAALMLRPDAAWGCASCFGQSDSSLAQGMNWGILAMLVVVVGMWAAFGTFFVYLARRASKTPAEPDPTPGSPDSTTDVTTS